MIDGRLAGSYAAVLQSGGGGGRAACHPRLLLSPASGALLLGYRLQWVKSVGAGGGIRGVELERSSGKGATQSTLRGSGRVWVELGWHWEMAEAVVRGRCQQAFRAADTGPRGWEGTSTELGPRPSHFNSTSISDHLPSPDTRVSPSRPIPLVPENASKVWKVGRMLTHCPGGRNCVTWGKGGSLPPPPHSHFSCTHWLPPRRDILEVEVPVGNQQSLGWSCPEFLWGMSLSILATPQGLGQH